jgi:hypothetical protein
MEHIVNWIATGLSSRTSGANPIGGVKMIKHTEIDFVKRTVKTTLKPEEQPPIAGSAICSADSWKGLDWPNPKARFEIYDDGDPHGQLAIILPGGQLMVCSGHADLETDLRRAKWICDALNEKRDRENPPNAHS